MVPVRGSGSVGVEHRGGDLQANECQKEGVAAEEVEDYDMIGE